MQTLHDFIKDWIADQRNSEMIARDGEVAKPIINEVEPDRRGEPFGRANRFDRPDSHGQWWLR